MKVGATLVINIKACNSTRETSSNATSKHIHLRFNELKRKVSHCLIIDNKEPIVAF